MTPALTTSLYMKRDVVDVAIHGRNQSGSFSTTTSHLLSRVKSQIAPATDPEHAIRQPLQRNLSRATSSEIAPEIVVWTEDMDVDSDSRSDESDGSLEQDIME